MEQLRGVLEPGVIRDSCYRHQPGFAKFHSEAVETDSYRFGNRQRLNDQEAQELALKSLGGEVLNSIKTLSKSQRAEPLRALYSIGLSVRQIERVTGIGRWSIERALG